MDAAPERRTAREIVSARFLPFPSESVFHAFRDPARLAQWWGPCGFTNTFQQFEFRPGGTWKFNMRGPDGTTYPMAKQFVEIVPPERIVVRHHQANHDFVLTMTFTVRGAGTEMVWRMMFEDPAEAEKLQDFLPRANEENFDRLEAHLDRTCSQTPPAGR